MNTRRFVVGAPIVMVLGIACVVATSSASAQSKASDSSARPIDAVLAHAIYAKQYVCSEHHAGQLPYVGDDLGQDCMITDLGGAKDPLFIRTYVGGGTKNSDWYGWDQPVLSPCTCTVVKINVNPKTNQPGDPGKPPASFVVLKQDDGVFFFLAHIQSPSVRVGDKVHAGDAIARVGNNGYARNPHIHIGAWKGKDALQIRWDQRTMAHEAPRTPQSP